MNRLFCNLCNCLRGNSCNRCCCCDCSCDCCCDCSCDCSCEHDSHGFNSSYLEALGNQQDVALGGSFVFDAIDKAGNDIEFINNSEFVLKARGLYQVEWSANLVSNASILVGITENDVPTSALTSATGVTSSGALVKVGKNPVVITLKSFGGAVTAVCPTEWINTAVSIRVHRFADGA